MKRHRAIVACLAMSALAAGLLHVAAQTESAPASAPPADQAAFGPEQLEQMVAPIALYSDGLLSQIFMAATYPLEIVQAARWREKNPDLKGPELEEALKEFDWDPAVKSLTGFPDVLKRMYDNLDWTQDVGDAMLSQRKELMDAVQRMRRKAHDSGNLKSSEHQTVTEQAPQPAAAATPTTTPTPTTTHTTTEKIIVIEDNDPEVVYVPQYSSTVVYAGWGYPAPYYPAFYYPPAPGYGFMAFTAGVAWGAAVWGDCDWNNGDVDIDVNNKNKFENNSSRNNIKGGDRNQVNPQGGRGEGGRGQGGRGQGGREGFKHNPEHRKGVGYRDNKTASQFGGGNGSNRVSQGQARGYGGDRGASAGTRDASRGGGPSAGTRDANRGGGPSAGTRDTNTGRAAMGNDRPTTRDSANRAGQGAYSGSRNSSMDRSASSRGASSRNSRSYGGGSSSRGGGGFSGGGGRGGGRGGGGRGGRR